MIVSLTAILFALSVASGMLGIGVAFAAVPFLSFYLPDLVNQVQPLSLLLNGVTALFSCFAFAQRGYVPWRRAGWLALCTTACAPPGAWLARLVAPAAVWMVYFASVVYVCYRLFKPQLAVGQPENFRLALILAVPISIVSGFLGVGPGFLLMPALMLVGFDARRAAGMNALAVTPSSFAAVLPHVPHAQFDLAFDLPLLIVGAVGSFVGGRLASRAIPEQYLRLVFGAAIVGATLYQLARMLF